MALSLLAVTIRAVYNRLIQSNKTYGDRPHTMKRRIYHMFDRYTESDPGSNNVRLQYFMPSLCFSRRFDLI